MGWFFFFVTTQQGIFVLSNYYYQNNTDKATTIDGIIISYKTPKIICPMGIKTVTARLNTVDVLPIKSKGTTWLNKVPNPMLTTVAAIPTRKDIIIRPIIGTILVSKAFMKVLLGINAIININIDIVVKLK